MDNVMKSVLSKELYPPKQSRMKDLLDTREFAVLEIVEAQSKKRRMEEKITDQLIKDGNLHCFSINWNAVNRNYK